jgi:hypothetical protein
MPTECCLNYHIVDEDDVIIASFRVPVDRNLALRTMRETYPEYTFEALND